MGSSKWGVLSALNRVLRIVTMLLTLLITTHDPPSMVGQLNLGSHW